MAKTLYILDGHSQIYRAYYAPFRDLTSPTGEPTRATYVFCNMLLKFLQGWLAPSFTLAAMVLAGTRALIVMPLVALAGVIVSI